MKLPNGYGSVYKLKGNRRRPWIARVTIGWSPKGKQLYHTVGYFKSSPEALAALAEYHKNPIGKRRDITLDALYEEWTSIKYDKITPKTAASYKVAWDNHLSELKDMRVRDIKTSHLQKIINKMIKNGLSYSSCQKVRVLASLLFKFAMADDIISQNYADLVEMPKADAKQKDKAFTDMEIKKITEFAKIDEWANTILILIYTGLRINELLTLTKFNVDLKHMTITGGSKTEAGKDRIIPIHPIIQPYIKYWYEKEGTHLIQRNGKPISYNYYSKYLYYPVLEKLKIRKLSPHATRHTFASLLDRANANPKAAQALLGHANYETTANIYVHKDINDLKKAIESI